MPDNTPARTPRNAALGVAFVLVAAAAGFLIQRRWDHGAAPQISPVPPAPPAAAAPAASPAGSAAAPKSVPEVLPDFELKDRDGTARKLAQWRGRPLVVNFWATWCPPCRREIPLLKKIRAQRHTQNVEVVGIAVDFRDDVLAYAAKEKLDYPLLIGEEDGLAAVTAVGMTPAFPFTLFADSQQRIVALKVGELHQEELDLILDRVAAVDAARLDLPAARAQISEGLKDLATKRALAEAAKPPKTAG
jgi:thiol-disulfide isomerase/thioredoxin